MFKISICIIILCATSVPTTHAWNTKTHSIKDIMQTVNVQFKVFSDRACSVFAYNIFIFFIFLFTCLAGNVEKDLIPGVIEKNPKVSWIWRQDMISSILAQLY